MLNNFRIFYTDGSEYSGQLKDAPRFGVAAIVEGNTIHHKRDFYVHTIKGWICCDIHGVLDHIMHQLDEVDTVLAGRSLPNADYWAIYEKAKQCRDNG